MVRKRYDDPLDILTPLDEQPEEIKQPHPTSNSSLNVEVGTPTQRLEQAADLLLTQIPQAIRTFFHEVCHDILHISHWELLLGSLIAQYEQGNLVAPHLDPRWKNPSFIEEESECEYCKKPYRPQRPNQRFCSSLCGGLKRKEEVEKRMEEERVRYGTLLLKKIETMKEEVEKVGKRPTEILIADSIYSIIKPLLNERTKDTIYGMKIRIDESSYNDGITILA